MPPQLQHLTAIDSTIGHDLLRFAPELAIIIGIVLVLLARIVGRTSTLLLGIGSVVVALTLAIADWPSRGVLFDGMLEIRTFATFFRVYILVTILLVLIFCRLTGFPNRDESADFTTLILGGCLGMMLMPSANHVVMIFLAVEMASLPSYVLAGFRRNRLSSEASLKYVVYGAAASGVMLYGLSLIAGRCETGDLGMLAARYAELIQSGEFDLSLAIGTLFLFVGLLFKLAAVPMHIWLPEVFAGASMEVAALLAIASKAAAIGLTLRLLGAFGIAGPRLMTTIGPALAILAMLTMTFGNIVALVQTDLKRMWAFSTIAHAGYMLLGISTCLRSATPGVLVYLMGYLPMTLGVFVLAWLVSRDGQTATVASCRGLLKRSPWVGVASAICLFSLLGLPPLVGFAGKFQVFAATYEAANIHGSAGGSAMIYYIALGVAVVNTVISAGYYLGVLRAVALDEPADDDAPLVGGSVLGLTGLLVVLAIAIVLGGLFWDPLLNVARLAAFR